ncbi:MAG: cytochrome P450 [Chloroflexi bacterium]|nr:cytochrome P450 [Chloroflexota bacterium]
MQTCTRHITRPVNIQGVQMQPGETVQCLLGAANRDPLTFARPDAFDLDRPNSADHLAFGTGRHFCIGSALARLEAQIGLRILLDRLTNLRAAPGCERDAPSGHEFRAPRQLRVAWDMI